MSYPWIGRREPLPADAFVRAADRLSCEVAAIRAIWQVEAGGQYYLSDGSVIRRFEPHHMPGSRMTWRDSLKLSRSARERAFGAAFAKNPDAALRATSWGAPQIMGFNAADTGFASARAMVVAMANSEWSQLLSFVNLVETWGLATKLRAHDWTGFARRYNGSGQPEVYGRRIEAAYRQHAGGKTSPQVLRIGMRGDAVRRLQRAVGVPDDGAFGPVTAAALRDFQRATGLTVDGIAGARTWAALEAKRGAEPKAQPTNTVVPLLCGLIGRR